MSTTTFDHELHEAIAWLHRDATELTAINDLTALKSTLKNLQKQVEHTCALVDSEIHRTRKAKSRRERR